MSRLQGRILFIGPMTAIFTFFVAAFFGWSIAQRMMELRLDERTKERFRIAGELHDGVLQQITSLTLRLGTVKQKVSRNPEAQADIRGLQKELMQVGTDIRRISHELHPAVLEEVDLTAALSTYCAEFSKTRGISISCETDGTLKELSP
jgi:signal transduction histidine kinase